MSDDAKTSISLIPDFTPSVPDKIKEKIYDDGLQPITKESGKLLTLPVQVINKILQPLSKWATSGEENTEKLQEKVAEKLMNVPPENIVPPKQYIAVPAIIANSYTDSDKIRNLYAGLLAKSMDKNSQNDVHPSYVEVIKQLSSQEALFLKTTNILKKNTASCKIRYQVKSVTPINLKHFNLHENNILRSYESGFDVLSHYIADNSNIEVDKISFMIENMERLKLVNISYVENLANVNSYSHFYFDSNMKKVYQAIEKSKLYNKEKYELAQIAEVITPTEYGISFYNICVK